MAFQVQDEVFEDQSPIFEPIFEDEIRNLNKKKDPDYKKLESACWNRFTSSQGLKKSDRIIIKQFAHTTLQKHNEKMKQEKNSYYSRLKIACMTCFFAGACCNYLWTTQL